MAVTATRIWNDIVGQLRVNHPKLVRGWFSDLEMTEMDQGVIGIEVRNQAQLSYLEQHCRGAFSQAAQAATGRLVTVAFKVCLDDKGDSGTPFSDGDDQLKLSQDYTFDNFVTGPCNRLGHAAAQAVADDPGRAYNPFFVHGPAGLGKTHLLQAICHSVRARAPTISCQYLSCETFINHFIEAVEDGALHQFRFRYRHIDVLMIDDIQFLAERERSQEEFFHTFNTLYQSQRQIVLSADCSPAEIPSLEERLVSRFNSGLVALLDRPCLETRMAIVRKKTKLRCIEVPEDVVRLIAARIETNIREMEGALIKIDALSQTVGSAITLDLAREALGAQPLRPVQIPAILEVVSRRFNIKVSDLQGKKRFKAVTFPRHISMHLARRLTGHSLQQIGGYFGGRDHSTVLHASRTIGEQATLDADLQAMLDELALEVKNVSP